MKKGRHRRFEEARALKRGPDIDIEHILEVEDEDDTSLPGRSAWYEEEQTDSPSETTDQKDPAG